MGIHLEQADSRESAKAFGDQAAAAQKSSKTIATSFSDLKASTLGAIAAVSGMTAFILKSVEAAAAGEVAVSKLSFAFKNSGISTRAAVEQVERFAAGLQLTTATHRPPSFLCRHADIIGRRI